MRLAIIVLTTNSFYQIFCIGRSYLFCHSDRSYYYAEDESTRQPIQLDVRCSVIEESQSNLEGEA